MCKQPWAVETREAAEKAYTVVSVRLAFLGGAVYRMSHSSGAQVEYVAQGDVLNTTSESFGITIHRAANVALSFFMALLLFALGCSIDVSRVKAHVWRPWGILVGLLCQFGVMPLAAFLLALASAVKPVQAVAFLIMGCSPGGTLSNIVTFWIDGDMDLRCVGG